MKWIFRGNDRGFFCPKCNSRCLCATDGDWLPSAFCPHCGQPLESEAEGKSTPVIPPYVTPTTAWQI